MALTNENLLAISQLLDVAWAMHPVTVILSVDYGMPGIHHR